MSIATEVLGAMRVFTVVHDQREGLLILAACPLFQAVMLYLACLSYKSLSPHAPAAPPPSMPLPSAFCAPSAELV